MGLGGRGVDVPTRLHHCIMYCTLFPALGLYTWQATRSMVRFQCRSLVGTSPSSIWVHIISSPNKSLSSQIFQNVKSFGSFEMDSLACCLASPDYEISRWSILCTLVTRLIVVVSVSLVRHGEITSLSLKGNLFHCLYKKSTGSEWHDCSVFDSFFWADNGTCDIIFSHSWRVPTSFANWRLLQQTQRGIINHMGGAASTLTRVAQLH